MVILQDFPCNRALFGLVIMTPVIETTDNYPLQRYFPATIGILDTFQSFRNTSHTFSFFISLLDKESSDACTSWHGKPSNNSELRFFLKNPLNMWVLPKIGVPQNGWFIRENPIRIDDLGGKHPYFWFNTPCFVCAFFWAAKLDQHFLPWVAKSLVFPRFFLKLHHFPRCFFPQFSTENAQVLRCKFFQARVDCDFLKVDRPSNYPQFESQWC